MRLTAGQQVRRRLAEVEYVGGGRILEILQLQLWKEWDSWGRQSINITCRAVLVGSYAEGRGGWHLKKTPSFRVKL